MNPITKSSGTMPGYTFGPFGPTYIHTPGRSYDEAHREYTGPQLRPLGDYTAGTEEYRVWNEWLREHSTAKEIH
jgi:hypothetical protein